VVTDAKVAAANKDGTAGTASMRTLGTSATQAAAGNHTHTGARVPATVNSQTGTSYTLAIGDANNIVDMTNAGASTLTVPPNSAVAFPVGTVVEGNQLGAGQVTLTPGAGVTINASPGLKIAAQYGSYGLRKTATDVWVAYGRLST
jgi:2-keto-4-pentenoate hydratase